MEPMEPDRVRGRAAPLLMASGGVIGVVGSFLTWIETRRGTGIAPGRIVSPGQTQGQLPRGRPVGGGRSLAVSGLDTTNGRMVLALLVALVLVAVVAWLATRFWFSLGAVSAGLVLGVIVLVLTVAAVASPDALVGVRSARLTGAGVTVTAGIGVYFALVGSAVAVVAGGFWLITNRRSWAGPARATPQPTTAPPPRPEPDPAEQPTTQLPPLTEPGVASD